MRQTTRSAADCSLRIDGQNPVELAICCCPQTRRLRRGQSVTHYDKAVAVKELGGSFHLVGSYDRKSSDPALLGQSLPVCDDERVVKAAGPRGARRVTRRQIAMLRCRL